jgi:hypothetical protein
LSIEAAQLIIVVGVLIIGVIVDIFLRLPKIGEPN